MARNVTLLLYLFTIRYGRVLPVIYLVIDSSNIDCNYETDICIIGCKDTFQHNNCLRHNHRYAQCILPSLVQVIDFT